MRTASSIPVGDVSYADVVRFCRRIELRQSSRKRREGCWYFNGYKSPKGYGQFWMGTRAHWAHRISYRIFVAEIVDGMHVHHTCANPGCVNPAHLTAMTAADNVAEGNTRRHHDTIVTQEKTWEEKALPTPPDDGIPI